MSKFVNSQMEKIMLSKMNSEISAMYVSGFNKFEGTTKELYEQQMKDTMDRIKVESKDYEKQKKERISRRN